MMIHWKNYFTYIQDISSIANCLQSTDHKLISPKHHQANKQQHNLLNERDASILLPKLVITWDIQTRQWAPIDVCSTERVKFCICVKINYSLNQGRI